ncbi:aldehyde dehydrogenase family protein [Rhodococcoides yunnanense]|uniref:aldehyde dehydrogenase family protein n=1 Tax=Rhodococcoides yunnanense TaxID=278209 RepID=UPI0009351E5F|nr:aldehyde dehydrogenase family protein [Rhodococcus yunnanensis]
MSVDFEAGVPSASSDTFAVTNPATGQPFAYAPSSSAEHLDAVVQAAHDAFPDWSRDEDFRRSALGKASAALAGAAQQLAVTLSKEQGKPIREAVLEIHTGAHWLNYFAQIEDAPQVIQDDDSAHVEVLRRPLGPVAAITPWNFPIALSLWKIAPALRAGNTVVVKPSPFTPLTTLAMADVLSGVFPPGVLSVITGEDPLGSRLASHPLVRKISFTGSTATGKKVAALAAEDLKRVTLELGGNDAAIVLPDADVSTVAPRLFGSALANNGQICVAVKRTYVHESMYSQMIDALAECARGVVLGAGDAEGTTHGPLNNAMQLDRVSELVDDAVRSGAQVVSGGKRWGTEGYFYEPTILANVSDGTRVVDEEQFGPVMPVIPYRTVDEAIARANASHYGLGSSIWSADVTAAQQLAPRLEAGTTWVNSHTIVTPGQPFGGAKWSGLGVEGGHWGLHSFSEPHVVYTAR